jgi:dolichol-phosphate mannosyltransferase
MNQGKLSIILCSYQSGDSIVPVYNTLKTRFASEKISFELIIVDDASTDNSYEIAKLLAKTENDVFVYRLAKNSTSPYSTFAGMTKANGSCIIPIADDFQVPMDTIVAMYRLWEHGSQLVICNRESRSDGFFADVNANIYYRFMNAISNIQFPKGGSDGYLFDREIVDIINLLPHVNNTTPLIEALRLGFDPEFLPYVRPKTVGKSRWTFKKKIKLASDTFYSSSAFPIKLITWLGFTIFFLSLMLILFIISLKLFSDNTLFGLPIPGWTTIVVLICLFNGLVLFSLGIVAEYIWRIHEDLKGRPPFIIKKNDK